MACLTHEKPFAGVNGSGKHVNWSLGSKSQGNLLDPGETPHENAQFLVFCAAVIRAVYKYQGLLRAVVATAGNDHRLGANEAPPAIISIFLGDQLTDVFEQIKGGGAKSSLARADADRRCRRAAAAAEGCRRPQPHQSVCLHRQSVRVPRGRLESIDRRTAGGDEHDRGRIARLLCHASWKKPPTGNPDALHAAVQKLLTEIINECEPIVFNGDGYSAAWHQEAAKRGLLNMKTAVDALPMLDDTEVKALFAKYNVLSERELKSRLDIYLEQYCKTVTVEGMQTLEMAKTLLFPAAIRYQNELASTCANLKLVGYEFDTDTLDKITELVKCLQDSMRPARQGAARARRAPTCWPKPSTSATKCCRPWRCVRKYADELEGWVADDLWPLPTYQEMLFIK